MPFAVVRVGVGVWVDACWWVDVGIIILLYYGALLRMVRVCVCVHGLVGGGGGHVDELLCTKSCQGGREEKGALAFEPRLVFA